MFSLILYMFSLNLYVFSLILFIFSRYHSVSQLICIQSRVICSQFTFTFCKHVQCVVLHVENLIRICSSSSKNECMHVLHNKFLKRNKANENFVEKENFCTSSNDIIFGNTSKTKRKVDD